MAWACKRPQKGRGKGKNAPRRGGATNLYEELVNAPNTHIEDSPISRLAEQVAVDPIGSDWNARHTDRMWTNRQGQLRLYKHGFFTAEQALRQYNNQCDVSVSSSYFVFLLSAHVFAWSSRPPASEANAHAGRKAVRFESVLNPKLARALSRAARRLLGGGAVPPPPLPMPPPPLPMRLTSLTPHTRGTTEGNE